MQIRNLVADGATILRACRVRAPQGSPESFIVTVANFSYAFWSISTFTPPDTRAIKLYIPAPPTATMLITIPPIAIIAKIIPSATIQDKLSTICDVLSALDNPKRSVRLTRTLCPRMEMTSRFCQPSNNPRIAPATTLAMIPHASAGRIFNNAPSAQPNLSAEEISTRLMETSFIGGNGTIEEN